MSTERAQPEQLESTDLSGLTAVVLNWESPDSTIRAASALLADGLLPEQLLIVDNGSKDASYERLVEELPGCRIVKLPENVGFGGGMNAGVRAAEGESYLLVQSDAFVHKPGTVRALARALDSPSVGIVAPRVLHEDLTFETTVTALQTPGVALVRSSGLSRLIPNRWQPSWGTHWDHGSSREIQQAVGVVFLVRAVTWQRLGGFDERMALSAGMDHDLCYRARQAGWKVWFAAEAEFVHVGGTSLGRHSNQARRKMEARGEEMMLRLNLGRVTASLSLMLIAFGLLARTALFFVTGRKDAAAELWASLRGYLGSETAYE